MEKTEIITIPFVNPENPSKMTFSLTLSRIEVETLTLKDLDTLISKKALEKKISVSHLKDFFNNSYDKEGSFYIEKQSNYISYFLDLIPFSFKMFPIIKFINANKEELIYNVTGDSLINYLKSNLHSHVVLSYKGKKLEDKLCLSNYINLNEPGIHEIVIIQIGLTVTSNDYFTNYMSSSILETDIMNNIQNHILANYSLTLNDVDIIMTKSNEYSKEYNINLKKIETKNVDIFMLDEGTNEEKLLGQSSFSSEKIELDYNIESLDVEFNFFNPFLCSDLSFVINSGKEFFSHFLNVKNPKYKGNTGKNETNIQVFVKNLFGKCMTINTNPEDSINVFKCKIKRREGIPINQQNLTFAGRKVVDLGIFKNCGIQKESTIQLTLALRGGGQSEIASSINFVDISKNTYEDKTFSDFAPCWRVCDKGLNIEGICLNKSCQAYNKQVICPFPNKSVFDLILDVYLIECPICKLFFEPLTCGFTKCEYTCCGIKVNKDGSLENFRVQNWTNIGHKYRYFNPITSGSVKWKQLKILIKPSHKETDAQNSFCGLCGKIYSNDRFIRSDEASKEKIDKKSCNHLYHETCYIKLNQKCHLC